MKMFHRSEVVNMLELPGIYYLYSKRRKLIYIGRAVNLKKRLWRHYLNYEHAKERIERMNHEKCFIRGSYDLSQVKPFEFFRFSFVFDEDFLHLLELDLIDYYDPPYNYKPSIMEPENRKYFGDLWKWAKQKEKENRTIIPVPNNWDSSTKIPW